MNNPKIYCRTERKSKGLAITHKGPNAYGEREEAVCTKLLP